MRSVPAPMQVKLDAGVTTLAQCWVVRRRDGVVQGFTDHDCDLTVNGVLCRAGTGLAASEAAQRFDLSVDGAEISGALSDTTLSEADLAAGRYDAASVDSFLVDWSDPSLTLLTARSTLGEVKREGQAFNAELRGLADLLSQESGRLYTAHCGADLGDARCQVNLGNPAWHCSGVVVATLSPALIAVSGLDGFAEGLFTAGRLTWTSGANAGSSIEIKQHRFDADAPRLTLWQAMAEPIAIGDAFAITAGCDKRFSTCRDRFGNALNFRGFPQIPGNDFVISYPVPGNADVGIKGGGWQAPRPMPAIRARWPTRSTTAGWAIGPAPTTAGFFAAAARRRPPDAKAMSGFRRRPGSMWSAIPIWCCRSTISSNAGSPTSSIAASCRSRWPTM
jgi:uncharacterized phage protein (TIGR02218 family)